MVTDVVDKGISLVLEPIKIIVASIIGGIIVLFTELMVVKKFVANDQPYRAKYANNITTQAVPVYLIMMKSYLEHSQLCIYFSEKCHFEFHGIVRCFLVIWMMILESFLHILETSLELCLSTFYIYLYFSSNL